MTGHSCSRVVLILYVMFVLFCLHQTGNKYTIYIAQLAPGQEIKNDLELGQMTQPPMRTKKSADGVGSYQNL